MASQKCLNRTRVSHSSQIGILRGLRGVNSLPININSAEGGTIRQSVPRTNREVEMILVATPAAVLDGDNDGIPSPADPIAAADVLRPDLVAAEWRGRFS